MKVVVRWVFLVMLVVAVIMSGSMQEASASILLGTTGTGGTGSTLVELDPTTGGLISTIGSVGYAVNGLEYDRTTGKLYGSTSVLDPSFNGLIEINLVTGAGTPIGVPGWGLTGTTAVTNIRVNAAGQMYGWWDPSEDDLVSIDKSTGVATRVGESGVSTAANGLSFDSSGTLYMVNVGGGYYTVDTGTGAATYAGDILSTAHHGDFDLSSNLYYGIDATYGSRNLVVADLSTGLITSTLPTVADLHTLTFVQPVPIPGALLLFGPALAGLGLLRRRFLN